MRILAIDTSCDETSVAIVHDRRVIVNRVFSQILMHKDWGGVVPVIAQKAHVEHLPLVIEETLKAYRKYLKSSMTDIWEHIDAIAVTQGPGLAIALEVGIRTAKELSQQHHKPLIPVNSSFVQNRNGKPERQIEFPLLGLLVSGGHTEIVLWKNHGEYEILSETLDDAAGECLDKAAKMLGLGYPGAPVIEKLAHEAGNIDTLRFPRSMIKPTDKDMSFSGLKTAFYYHRQKYPDGDLHPLASSIQEAVFDSFFLKVKRALLAHPVRGVVCGGGVVVNKRFRHKLRKLVKQTDMMRQRTIQDESSARSLSPTAVFFPPHRFLCGDNAAMIGVAAALSIKPTDTDLSTLDRIPRMRLSD